MSDNQVSVATLGNAVGVVIQVSSAVSVQSIDGQERSINVGDPIFYGETVVSTLTGSAIIEFIDGTQIVIENNSVVEITDEIYFIGESEELIADSSSDVDALQEAILAGIDPTLIQEAPAAGEEADAEEGGLGGAETVQRTGEEALPEYGYDTNPSDLGGGNENLIDVENDINTSISPNGSSNIGTDSNSAAGSTTGPTSAPTEAPTLAPIEAPTPAPTEAPTPAPTEAPTPAPTEAPTPAPTEAPTPAPTEAPTPAPTSAPTEAPTSAPTEEPTPPRIVAPPVITNITDDSEASDYSLVTLHGTGEPGASITLYVISNSTTNGNNTQTGAYTTVEDLPITVDSSGNWTVDISNLDDVPVGDNEFFKAVQTDTNGNISADSNTVHYWHGDSTSQNAESEDDFVLSGADDDTHTINTDDDNDAVTLDGGAGNDTAKFSKAVSEMQSITLADNGNVIIVDDQGDTNILIEFEFFSFKDVVYSKESLLGNVTEDGVLQAVGTLTVSDADADESIFVAQEDAPGEYGSFSINAKGVWTYALNNEADHVQALDAGQTETETFTVTTASGETKTVTITINGTNDTPVAADDFASMSSESVITIDVLDNDTDRDGDNLIITDANVPSDQGLVEVVENKLVFTPASGFTGTASLTYTISDGNGGNDTANVLVSVTSVTVNPITSDDVINKAESDQTIAVTGTARGGDIAEGDKVTLVINSKTYTTTVKSDNTWSVDVAGSDLAKDTDFDAVVTSSDEAGNRIDTTGSSTHTVDDEIATPSISFESPGSDGVYNSNELGDDNTVTATITVTGSEVGDTLTYTVNDGSSVTIKLTEALIASGITIEVSPEDTVTATLSDAAGNTSDKVSNTAASAVIFVAPPVITNITDDSEASDYSLVTLHGTGEPGASITLYVISNSTTKGNNTQTGEYTKVEDLLITVDSSGNWTVDISNLDDVPVNDNEFFKAVQTDIYGNVSAESNTVHYYHGSHASIKTESEDDFVLSGKDNDTVNINADDDNDAVTIDGGAGDDTAKFSKAISEMQSITLADNGNVIVVDDQGDTNILIEFESFSFKDVVYSKESLLGNVTEDGVLQAVGTLTVSDADADESIFVAQEDAPGEYGSFSINAKGVWTYALNNEADHVQALDAGQTETDTFEVTTASGETKTVTITINGTNDTPVAADDSASMSPESVITIDVLDNDTDRDGDNLIITKANVPSDQGLVEVVENKLVFTPASGFTGTASLTYTISDGNGGSDTANVNVLVAVASVTVNPITSDDVINKAESDQTIAVTGTARGGDIAEGDKVTLVINSKTYTTTVKSDNTWSVDVAGSDLAKDTDFDAVVSSSDEAGNRIDTTGSSTHTVDTYVDYDPDIKFDEAGNLLVGGYLESGGTVTSIT
ncbi:retention module-containing protein, partial [Marinomonas sp. 2405UD68-3]|uniref:retention module-containing protein n=1 Tax=Marinomonas sp. 2405UD68-3 TaxID=3391835 RepID=UPI0039C97CE0